MANVSFGSIFNPERSIHSRHVEAKLINPENNLEGLNVNRSKNTATSPYGSYSIKEALGRSQVINVTTKHPKNLQLSPDDKKCLINLSSSQYGFNGDGKEFWFHVRKPNLNLDFPAIMGDGKLKDNETRKDFVKRLINDKTQAFQIAGTDISGENRIYTVIRNNDKNSLTMYICSPKECFSMPIDNTAKNENIVTSITKKLHTIQGATIWSEEV